ncbi:MAG: 2-C-methyl-D-erythritol 4-phosphate cytidylyltransferase [Gammaproteobacteria bacterium]|nr:2-C-methyl-D-erythritol 4-phosphate cytidylyltransferase [Gammaproteobacteria bacterium]
MPGREKCWGAVPAAGSGSRMASRVPKQYLILRGKTVLEHSLDRIAGHSEVEGVVVALAADDSHFLRLPREARRNLITVAGGAERCHSVLNCLRALRERAAASDWVLVHDAARPCVRRGDIDQLIAAVRNAGVGGILALPVRDTMKRADEGGRIEGTVERSGLWHALTPQMFRIAELEQALAAAVQDGIAVTDEAQAMERRGARPLLVQAHPDNIKITHTDDLALAELYLSQQEPGA